MAQITMAQLNKKLTKLAARYPTAANNLRGSVALAALRQLVFSTPVDTGLARGSWRVTATRPSTARPRKDKSGARTFSTGTAAIRAFKNIKTPLFITNTSDHLELINTGVIKITKAQPFAGPGFVEKGVRAAQIEVGKQSILTIARFSGKR